MYISLYRRYRPQKFSDVVGQSAAIGVITRAVESGAIGHAYLFSGPRGCGKTTVARLFAKAVNCPQRAGAEPCNDCETCRAILEGSCLDVIEIDGASNNSVDEIRDLKEHVALASFTCPYKVYIIDEVHMLSISAFNALLKTLEEPPERVIFILATTAPHKVPVTIRSRCQHIPFHGMTLEQIVRRLQQISETEEIDYRDEALWEIARNSEGGMRDALSLMEQAIALGAGSVTRETVDKLLGGGSSSSIRQWLSDTHAAPEDSLPILEGLFRSGAEPERFVSTLFVCVRNLWLQARWGRKILHALTLSEEERQWLEREKDFLTLPRLEKLMARIASLLPQIRRGLSLDVLCGLLVSWILESDAAEARPPEAERRSLAGSSPVAEVSAPFRDAGPCPPAAENHPSNDAAPAATEAKRPPREESAATDDGASPSAVEAIPPDVLEGLTPINDDIGEILFSILEKQPNVAIPLCLADILYDREKGELGILLDEDDIQAYQTLNSERMIKAVKSLLPAENLAVHSIKLQCGNDVERFERLEEESVFDNSPLPSAAEAEGNKERKKFPRADFLRDIAENVTAGSGEAGAPREEEAPVPARGSSLSDYLRRSFMDGDLLYCRPNESPDEEANGEDS